MSIMVVINLDFCYYELIHLLLEGSRLRDAMQLDTITGKEELTCNRAMYKSASALGK